MTLINTLSSTQADDELVQMYQRQEGFFGYLPNYARVFSWRPHIMKLWANLQSGIRSQTNDRLFELVTLVAAYELKSTYCALAHSQNLLTDFRPDELICILKGGSSPTLSATENAALCHARILANHAEKVTQADIQRLYDVGFDDAAIFDITAIVAGRAFFTKLVEGLGARADVVYQNMDENLRRFLTVGRPISAITVNNVANEANGAA